ncbi:dihydroxyacetone kinase family protein [Microbacterium capsulatum]|uniref:Dihydroxyacetone kinase family protein n=1 Tax=Microbacterium capsulatum TaxID=3041921 RepID=A0ABU0XEF6_9MICO|nr:dihydroxyacetone kinase family protein [Microbacterium sp. ASV81]MDQ4213494.1 dihydroxyacetone kinase family protein [Microbacterium sp. ASV81]
MTALSTKLINAPEDFVDEVIDGILGAHGDGLRAASGDARAIVRTALPAGTVGIVTGGGSGHLPLFLGYVGTGLCSGVAVGNVFSSPSPEQIHAATVASDTGAGVLYLYGNYGGDVFNFDLAADLAALDGIRTATVLGADDVASAPREKARSRRGVAGIFFAYKIAGASAARGDDLDTVASLAQRAADRTGTMGVGLAPTVLPTTGKPSFDLAEGQMEIGVGIHGEPGRRTGPIAPADAVADELVQTIVADLGIERGARVAVLVNGLGATPLEELYLLSRRTRQLLDEREVRIHRAYVGEFATSLEMAGASISILALDDELAALLDAPADSPFFAQGGVAPEAVTAAAPVHETGDPQTTPSADSAADSGTAVATAEATAAGAALAAAITAVAPRWAAHADELRDLDAALGDGDLGITVSSGVAAILVALDGVTATDIADPVLRAGRAFATANPSTFAALVGGGLLAAGGSLQGHGPLDRAALVAAMRALAARIAERGKAQAGDKTVLDALLPSIDALAAADADPRAAVAAMRAAAWAGVRGTTELVSQRGRAAWVGERSAGRPDPGATAYARLLDEVAAWLDETA